MGESSQARTKHLRQQSRISLAKKKKSRIRSPRPSWQPKIIPIRLVGRLGRLKNRIPYKHPYQGDNNVETLACQTLGFANPVINL